MLQENTSAVFMLCAVIPGDHTNVRVKRDITEMEEIVNQVRLNGQLKGMFKKHKPHVVCGIRT